MPIASLTLELRIEGAHSLKDKRQVVRSLKDRLRAHFNIAVAEIEADNAWQRATIGVVSISGSRDYLDGLMRNTPDALDFIKTAQTQGVRAAVERRDGPFGDYSQAPPERRPDPSNVIEP